MSLFKSPAERKAERKANDEAVKKLFETEAELRHGLPLTSPLLHAQRYGTATPVISQGTPHASTYPDPLPEWSIGMAHGEFCEGAQCPTKDGRRHGNAHVIRVENEVYTVLTDAGTTMRMSLNELRAAFWPPAWVSDTDQVIHKFGR